MEIRVLGPVEAVLGGRPLRLGGSKQRAVLALLALNANATVSVDRLIEGLWGEQDQPASATKMVQLYVSQLRKLLVEDAGAEIVTRGRGYELRIDPETVDAVRFERLVVEASRADTEDGAGEAARAALALWRGPPLADLLDEPFAPAEARRLEELHLAALEERLEADLALGRHAELVPELEALVREHPLRERMRAQLMLALYRAGRQAEALEAYRQGHRALVDELGIEPGPALRELHGAILEQDPELGAPARRRAVLPATTRRGRLLMALGGAVVLAAGIAAAVVALIGGGEGSPSRTGICSPVVSAPDASPRVLIAADLPLSGVHRALGAQMDAAVRHVLRERRFQAGRYSVGYQVCDAAMGAPNEERRCERNARAYARNPKVLGVIGTFSSGCATVEIPIANRAGLAMLSPSNTYIGLTQGGPGAAPGEPDRFYPTGRRTYARIVADDRVQAAAQALLARRLGIRRLFLLEADYSVGLTDAVGYAADRLGVRVVGRDGWEQSGRGFTALVERPRQTRPDGVLLSGALVSNEGDLIRELRAALPEAQLLATDGFTAAGDRLVDAAGPAAEGMSLTIAGSPPDALGPRGRAFVAALSRDLGVAPQTYSVYAAEAAEVMLDAIARSSGTRASVVHELFQTRVRDGLLGDYALTPRGDTTDRAIAVYRIERGSLEYSTVLRPGRDLVAE